MNKISIRTKATSSIAVLALLTLAGCGSDAASSDSTGASDSTAPAVSDESSEYGEPAATEPAATEPVATEVADTAAPAADAGAPILIADNDLGSILTDANGLTVYAFTNDVDGVSTCNDGCSGAWPPVVVDASFDVSTLPASGSFSLIERDDGTTQLKSGDSPLYTFSGDSAAGDTNGQGSGGVWFVVAADGSLVK